MRFRVVRIIQSSVFFPDPEIPPQLALDRDKGWPSKPLVQNSGYAFESLKCLKKKYLYSGLIPGH